MKESRKEIENLIIQNKIILALNKLKDFVEIKLNNIDIKTSKVLVNEIIHFASRFNSLQQQINLGIISNENSLLERNKLVAGLLDLKDRIFEIEVIPCNKHNKYENS